MVNIPVSADVVTSDGEVIGSVKEVRGEYFKIDARFKFDYWLSTTIIANSTASSVNLSVNSEEFAAYKMDRPNDTNEFQNSVPESLKSSNVQMKTWMIDGDPPRRF